jgi:cell division protein FtsB
MDEEKVSRRVKWGVVGLLAICAVLGFTLLFPARTGDSALWFVGLLVLTATALTLTAIVFGGLNLNDANEAFGLPSGSVRTLLAVGVMVLFAVFGLKFFGSADTQAGESRLADKPFAQVEVAPARLADEVERYKQSQSVLPVVVSPGRAASGADAGANAKLSLYLLKAGRPAEAVDAQKQLLTAIITLLTTVVGFYFGSKSAGDGLRARSDGTPTDPTAQQRQQAALTTEHEALEAHIKSDRDTLGRLREAPGGIDPAKVDEAQGLSNRLDPLREELATALTEAQTRLGAVGAAPAGGETAARDAAQKALARASAALDALKQAAQQFEAAVAKLRGK